MELQHKQSRIDYNTLVGTILNNYRLLRFYRKASPSSRSQNETRVWIECECVKCGYKCDRPYHYLKSYKPKNIDDCSNIANGCLNCWKTDPPILPCVYGEITKTCMSKIKRSAQRRGVHFDISAQYLWELFLEQDRRCFYTGQVIKFEVYGKDRCNGNYTASLDRIDSSLGYIEGNVQWVHKDINSFKFTYSSELYISICNLINTFDGKFTRMNYITPMRNGYWKGYGDISMSYWGHKERNARRRGIPFNILIEEAWDQYLVQGGICAITGQKLVFATNSKEIESTFQTASLDRTNANLPYLSSNCVWTHKIVNRTRWHFDIDYYKKVCKLVAVKHPRERSTIPLLETIK